MPEHTTQLTLNELKHQILLGVENWNKWRRQFNADELKLDGISLSGANLDNIDFSELSIMRASLRDCSMRHAHCINSKFCHSDLSGADLSKARLIAADISHANLTRCILHGASTLMLNSTGSKLDYVDFRGHDISTLSLRNASLAWSNLEGQMLDGADFSHLNLEGANLSQCHLRDTNFTGSNLKKAIFNNALISNTLFKQANLTGVSFKGMSLINIHFESSNLSHTDLREVNLSKALLSDTILTGAKLWQVNMRNWVVDDVECDYAYWGEHCDVKTQYKQYEFERLYSQSDAVQIKYPHRVSTQEIAIIPIIIEHLQATFWGALLHLKSLSEIEGGTLITLKIDEYGPNRPTMLKHDIQVEVDRIVNAHIGLRSNGSLLLELREEIANVKERFWPKLLELAQEYEDEQAKLLTIVFMDLKGFTRWGNDELSDKLALFRGLIKPILTKWGASYPNMEGDSLRITFSNTTTALACASMIKGVLTGAGFELRTGVEIGSVSIVNNEVTGVNDLEGSAVSMAARLESCAKPGQILVSNDVKQYSEHRNLFVYTPLKIRLNKSIGQFEEGAIIDCYDVTLKKSLNDF